MYKFFLDFLLIGWNLLSLTGQGTAKEFTDTHPCVSVIWFYNGTWNAYFPNNPEASDYPAMSLESMRGYWVYCKNPTTH